MHHARPKASPGSIVAVGMAALVAAIAPVATAIAADPVEVSFSPTGVEQQWTVPSGVTSIHVVLVGARGADNASAGGRGHVVTGDLAVTAGTTLYVEVGSDGSSAFAPPGGGGGFNGGGRGGDGESTGGGGGGGASDLRTSPRASGGSLSTRLIVAAGGGGAGGGSLGSIPPGGAGGSAGAAGANGQNGTGTVGLGGAAATSASGGTGGLSGPGTLDGGKGGDGVAGAGGAGAGSATVLTFGGGGAGGGYFGGGGGGAGQVGSGGGGGGGSSFTGDATNASVTANATTSGASVTITYTPGEAPPDPTSAPDTGVVDADVTVPTSAACVELSTTAVSFGTQRFGSVDVQAGPSITVTNCSGTDETLLARGTSAAGNGATWTLVDNAATCDAGTLDVDEFHLKLNRPGNEVDPVTQLSSTNKEIAEIAGGDDTTVEALLDMPCPGSDGAGQTMGMNIVFVVTEIE